ncbi:MAG: PAS domain S-box protein [Ignavibacteriaceae bacterium]|nr:PAS domain S-box protein [Ignavibacteriaceae bacterium]
MNKKELLIWINDTSLADKIVKVLRSAKVRMVSPSDSKNKLARECKLLKPGIVILDRTSKKNISSSEIKKIHKKYDSQFLIISDKKIKSLSDEKYVKFLAPGFAKKNLMNLIRSGKEDAGGGKIRNGKNHYKSFLDNIPIGIARFTEEGEILYANRVFIETSMFNKQPKDGNAKKFLESLKKTFSEKQSLETEFEIFEGNKQKYYSIIFTPELSANKIISSVLVTVNDITGLKLAEEEIWQSKEWFRAILKATQDSIVVEHNEKIIYLNEAVVRTFGYETTGELIGKPLSDLIINTDFQKLDMIKTKLNNKSYSGSFTEFTGVKQNGEEFPVEIALSNLLVANVAYRIAVIHDITQRKKAERTLQEKETLYRTLFNFSPSGIVLEDDKGMILEVNESICKRYNYSRDELIGKSVKIFVSDELKHLVDNHISQIISHKQLEHEIENITKEGQQRIIELREILIPLSENRKGILAVSNDITERKKAEAELQSSLYEKEILLREIHHRVKNNLQIISSIIDLQSESIKDTSILPVFQNIQKRVHTIALIHEKLYQSQNLSVIDMGDYLKILVDYLEELHAGQNIFVETTVESDNTSLSIDKAIPCGMIVGELVSNAFKHAFPLPYNPGRTHKLKVKFNRVSKGTYSLVVEDNGKGLNESFDINNATTLGLQLVNMLTENLKAKMIIERGEGTKFIINFNESIAQKR